MAYVKTITTKKGDKRYVLRYRARDGKQREQWFRSQGAAAATRKAVEADIMRNAWIDPRRANRTFKSWAEEWLASDPAKRPKTKACDESTLKLHLYPSLGQKFLGSITTQDVRGLVAKWTQDARPSTVRRRYAVLRAIFASALDSDLVARTPCRAIKLPKVEPTRRHVVTPAELRVLAEAVGPQHRALVYVGGVLGLRFAECAGLRVRNLDMLHRTLSVEETVCEARGVLYVGPPKSSAGRRTISMPHGLVAMLAEHLTERGLTARDADAYVFAAPEGAPLRYSTFRSRVWAPSCTRAGLKGLGFHDLRRTAATAMVNGGVDVRTAQTRLGHSDPRLTIGLYAQSTTEADELAALRVGDHFLSPVESPSEDASRGFRGVGGSRVDPPESLRPSDQEL